MSKSLTRQAVERGAKALTLHYGDERWMDRIRQADLDLGNPSYCVLGQTFGGYGEGKRALGAGVVAYPAQFGFDIPEGTFSRNIGLRYAGLNRAWRTLLARRRAGR